MNFWNSPMPLLERPIFGNTFGTWILAFVLVGTIHVTLGVFTAALKKRWAGKEGITKEVGSHLSPVFLFSISIYCATNVLFLRPEVNLFLSRVLILGGLFQASISGKILITYGIQKSFERNGTDETIKNTLGLMNTLARALLYATLFLLALNNFGVDITALIAGLGVGGIAVALAAQNILSDLFASLTIVLDQPFRIGDTIQIDTFSGTVEHIGLKTTRLRSQQGEEVIIPNASLLQNRIHNLGRMRERRVTLVFGITYETPYEKLRKVPDLLKSVVAQQPQTRFDRAHFRSMSASTLDFELVYWVQSADALIHLNTQESLQYEVIRRFESEGIAFAYPTQTVHVAKT